MKASLLLIALASLVAPLHAQERLSHGRFKDVTLYRPAGDAKQFVLFLSGDNGWEGAVDVMARRLAGQGALVAGIDVPQLFESLQKDGGSTFAAPNGVQPEPAQNATVVQGTIEKSNVRAVVEMSRMIEITRSYSQVANLLQQQGDMRRSAIERLAEVPA